MPTRYEEKKFFLATCPSAIKFWAIKTYVDIDTYLHINVGSNNM